MGAAAAVPTALAVAPTAPVAAATTAPPPADDPPPSFCATVMLTPEQLDAGVLSTVRCADTYEGSLRAIGVEPASAAGGASTSAGPVTNGWVLLADHYEEWQGGGMPLSIWGDVCDGGGVSFPAGDAWNDRIRATAPRACSRVKHFADAGFSGTAELITRNNGIGLSVVPGAVSSMRYYQ
jgi:hypothetical protein